MTGFEANEILLNAVADLDSWQPFGIIELSDQIDCSNAESVFHYKSQKWHFIVGCKDFVDTPYRDFKSFEVIMPVVNLYHEVCGHGLQYATMYKSSIDALSQVLCMNYCACLSSEKYYGGDFVDCEDDPTYFKQPYEMAAQYIGLRWAHDYLKTKDLPFDLDKAFVDYQKFRTGEGDGHDFIKWDPKSTTVTSILKQYEKGFPKVVRASRGYDHCVPTLEDEDEYEDSLIVFQNHLGDSVDYIGRLERCSDGLKQDMMAAAVYFRYHAAERSLFPAISGLDLDTANAYKLFSKPFLKTPKRKDLDLSAMDKLLRMVKDDGDKPTDQEYDFGNGP